MPTGEKRGDPICTTLVASALESQEEAHQGGQADADDV
jgi:hypothetical protein